MIVNLKVAKLEQRIYGMTDECSVTKEGQTYHVLVPYYIISPAAIYLW